MTPEFQKDRADLEREFASKMEQFETTHGVVINGFQRLEQSPFSTSTVYIPLAIRLAITVR